MRSEATQVMSGSFETGNKLLLNTANMKFFGKPRDRASRLLAPVYNGASTVLVDTDLDWVAGDRLYFAPTNLQWTHSEYRTIDSYNSATGLVTLTQALSKYHFGAGSSTAADYNGLDTRGEVRLLSRNVRILGDYNNDLWGGHILTTDRMEFDGTARYGTTQFDNVEVENCGQLNTYHAAIRFESTGNSKASFVRDSVVHGSEAWSMIITGSSNINIDRTDFIGAKAVGINLNSVQNVHLDDIFVADVSKRIWEGGD